MKSDLSSVMAAPMRSKRSTPVVGWRFHPTHEELVTNYLKPKMLGHDQENSVISEVNFCSFDPWDLPKESKMKSNDNVWYFYCPRDLKYKKSRLSNRTTVGGYWKPTGKRIPVKAKSTKKQIGVKKTLVFYKGRTNGVRTGWITHEYEWFADSNLKIKGDYTLCKLKNKSKEKTCKGAPDDRQMALSSDCEAESSDCMTNDYQNTTGMAANSTCNASELSHLVFDNENHSSSLSTTNSACDESINESIPSHPTEFDLGGQNSTETVISSACNDCDPDYNFLPALESHAPNLFTAYCSWPMDYDYEDWISLHDIETSNPDFIIGSPYDKGEPCSCKAFGFGDQNQDNYYDISGCKEGDQISPAAVKTPPNKENDISIPVENSSSYLTSLLVDDSLDDGWSKISPEQLTELGAELKALIELDSKINSINQPSCAPKEAPSAMAMDPFVSSGCLPWNSAIQ